MQWYVYVGKYDDKIVYIGKGKEMRYTHLNSGISSCYYANKVHFEGGLINVDIVEYFQSSEEALLYEKNLIIEIQPEWNIVFSTGRPQGRKGESKSPRRRRKGGKGSQG